MTQTFLSSETEYRFFFSSNYSQFQYVTSINVVPSAETLQHSSIFSFDSFDTLFDKREPETHLFLCFFLIFW